MGEKLAGLFGRKDILTIQDLLYFLPRTYEDRRRVLNVSEIAPGSRVVVIGLVARSHPVFYSKSKRRAFEMNLNDVNGKLGTLKLTWFHAPYQTKKLEEGTYVLVTGEVQAYRGQLQMVHPEIEILGKVLESEASGQGIVPIYSETSGLYQKTIRRILRQAVKDFASTLPDPLPEAIRTRRQFPKLSQAILDLHEPSPKADFDLLRDSKTPAHRRLIYDEFFHLSLSIALKRRDYMAAEGIAFPKPEKFWVQMKSQLPFQFTNAQKRVLQEILEDMMKPRVMHRLIQGDVGSGKTVIAGAAALVALEAGYQAALMAPTEILLDQHFKNFGKWFAGLGLECVKLTGSLSAKEKREALQKIEQGQAAMIFGTHALFEDEVKFKNLGLVIVDEQHRFGVRQRARLVQKGRSPDLLVMTATPIPRTLALTVYGDLDISVIDERPPGRQPIVTKVFTEKQRSLLESSILDQLKEGRQVYIVFPLIDESEKLNLKSLNEMLPHLREVFVDFKVSELHGRMKAEEKSGILEDFRQGKVHVLVSTTVVEVGVDVPNATIMVVEHAERFGLSQLHQLRGRVARGTLKSCCYLMASHLGTTEIVTRLRSMEQTEDGFKLSEIDLELRGPGELLGTRQSGEPTFSLARLPRDLDLLQAAKADAEAIVTEDPELRGHATLRDSFKHRVDKALMN